MSLTDQRSVAAPVQRVPRVPLALRLGPPLLFLVLGLGELLRDRSLWYDEAYSRLAAGVPLGTLLSGIWHRQGVIGYLMDVPPSFNGPYYALLHGWVGLFGDSAFSLRFASLLSAALAVAVLVELVRRVAGSGAAALAGLLLATGPLLVDETTQARSYGTALLALALALLWTVEWTETGRRLGPAVAATAVAGLLHWFTLPVVGGLVVHVLMSRRPGRARAATALVAACVPTLLLVGWSMAGGTYGAPHPVPVGAWLPVQAVRDWSGGTTTAATVLAIGLAALTLLGCWRSPHRSLLLGWVVLPLAAITAIELVRATYYPRYLLFTLTGLVVAAALGLSTVRPALLRRGLAAALVALSLTGTVATYGVGTREPTPAAIAYLASHQAAGEPIVPADGRVSLGLETYLDQAPRLGADLVLPPVLFTDQTASHTVWLVRVVLHEGSLPVVPAEQRLLDAGWTQESSRLLVGATTDLRVERWVR